MDKEKIFGLFDKDFDESLQKDLGDYKKSFHFKIGMFIKVVIYGDKWKNSSDLFISLMRTIKYFEKTEEFEKCAFLVKIRDLLK